MQDLLNRNWIFHGNREDYLNPADFLGIPNVEGTTAIYYGTPIVPRKKSSFPWAIYFNKFRARH